MLGIGRHAQYAGWGTGPLKIAYESTSRLRTDNYQTPVYSLAIDGNNRNWSLMPGAFDTTGYSSLSGYNAFKYTSFGRIYFVKDDYSFNPQSSDDYCGASIYYEMVYNNGDVNYYNPGWQLVNSNTQLQLVTVNGISLNLAGSYTQYMNRWLSFGISSSNSRTDYSEWSGTTATGTNFSYHRLVVFDSETGVLLGKQDTTQPGFWTPSPLLSNLGNTVYADNSSADRISIGGFGSGGVPYENVHRLTNLWASFGTMLDPLNLNAWNTTRPGRDIGSARAWINLQYTDQTADSTYKYLTDQPDDLYTPTTGTGAVRKFTADWDEMISTTIIPKDRS
jgi:hypothetical protein